MNRNIILPVIAAGAVILSVAACAPAHDRFPAPPAAVVTTESARLAPRCFETSEAGAQDCVWVPVAACLTDGAGDDAVPDGFDGCFWDANARGNHAGASYIYWRLNRD